MRRVPAIENDVYGDTVFEVALFLFIEEISDGFAFLFEVAGYTGQSVFQLSRMPMHGDRHPGESSVEDLVREFFMS